MKRSLELLAVLLCALLPAGSQASDLNTVVRAVESDFGMHRQHIPMLGFGMFVAKVVTGFQMPTVKLAVFEDARLTQHSREQIQRSLMNALGPEWSPLVKSTSNHGDRQSWIFARPEGQSVRMLIAAVERNEISLVEVKVGGRKIRKWVNDTDVVAKKREQRSGRQPR